MCAGHSSRLVVDWVRSHARFPPFPVPLVPRHTCRRLAEYTDSQASTQQYVLTLQEYNTTLREEVQAGQEGLARLRDEKGGLIEAAAELRGQVQVHSVLSISHELRVVETIFRIFRHDILIVLRYQAPTRELISGILLVKPSR